MILTACSETCAYVLYFLSQGEEEFDMPQPPHGHVLHRHMRTIREVRTLVTRVITDVYYVDGTEVERKVTEVIHTLSLCGKFLSFFFFFFFNCIRIQYNENLLQSKSTN